jgi:uncharacterized protein YjlB
MRLNTKSSKTQHFRLKDDGKFPNSKLQAVLYKGILDLNVIFPAAAVRQLFRSNNWKNFWKSGIFEYHHYHSVTHEAIAVIKGKTILQLGGPKGKKITIEKGDVLIIPAGVAHKNLKAENDVSCIGAYPYGKNYDMNYGKEEERPKADKNIKKVKLPPKDPVFGKAGGIKNLWK